MASRFSKKSIFSKNYLTNKSTYSIICGVVGQMGGYFLGFVRFFGRKSGLERIFKRVYGGLLEIRRPTRRFRLECVSGGRCERFVWSKDVPKFVGGWT